jgi:type II pantothenate kinase
MAANNSGDAPIPLEEGVKHEAEPEAKGKAPANSTSTMLHRSGSRPQLDLSGAAIHGALEDRNPTILLPNQSDDISHLALDIGGTSARPRLLAFPHAHARHPPPAAMPPSSVSVS